MAPFSECRGRRGLYHHRFRGTGNPFPLHSAGRSTHSRDKTLGLPRGAYVHLLRIRASRTPVRSRHEGLKSGALLVCAYEDESRFNRYVQLTESLQEGTAPLPVSTIPHVTRAKNVLQLRPQSKYPCTATVYSI